MKPSENCLALIRAHEGLRLKAYRCPAGVWTIGFGHTGDVLPGSSVDPVLAEFLLQLDAAEAAKALERLPLNQNQFDALVSFVFNLGPGRLPNDPRGPAGFLGSTMRRLIVDGLYAQAAAQFPRWVYANGRKLPGLVVRREDERALFERPV